jgi:hypothetical protein
MPGSLREELGGDIVPPLNVEPLRVHFKHALGTPRNEER